MRPQDLPIYRVTYELATHVTRITQHIPKHLRSTLATRIQGEAFDLVIYVYRAQAAWERKDRRQHIERIIEGIQVLELTLRLCMDMQLISPKQHARAAELTQEVGRQAGGWKKSSQ